VLQVDRISALQANIAAGEVTIGHIADLDRPTIIIQEASVTATS
jgi:hypothetical protein